jgi:hypothetical protein
MKPRLRLKGRVWSCTQYGPWYVLHGKYIAPFRVMEVGYGYTPMAAWTDLQSRLYDLS